jgi:hypothetical protein
MPRTCTICSHDERRKIDTAIVFGKSERSIAKQFGVTAAAIHRHKVDVAAALEKATEKREVSIAEGILDRLENLYARGLRSLSLAEKTKSHHAICSYLRELRGILAGLFEVGAAAIPKDAVRPLQGEYIDAICKALGRGPLIPLLPEDHSNGNGHSNGDGVVDADFEELPVLPQD